MRGPFQDRQEAGRELARSLAAYAHRDDVTLLALPRGGVPVGFEIATALGIPLEPFIVRKLGVPGQEELGFGAIASGGVRWVNHPLVKQLSLSPRVVEEVTARQGLEVERREQLYGDHRPRPQVSDRTVILIDDGLATGGTMLAAIQAIQVQQPASLVVAVPVGSTEGCRSISSRVDQLYCLLIPPELTSVGAWYREFEQVNDEEVRQLLNSAQAKPSTP
ncbi:MAG: phosphoribosyltransferase [Phycisphaerae bacterium]|nr:phosphoribosyltransferase [Phycisphaerae bacterium]